MRSRPIAAVAVLAVTFTVDRLWPGRGRGETSVKAGYAVRF